MKHRLAWAIAVTLVLAAQWVLAAPLEEIRQILRQRSLDPPPEAALTALREERLAESLKEIDPYARHFKAHEYRSPMLGRDAWIGIGAELVPRGGDVLLSVYMGGAADRAGVADRSALLEVDGKKIQGLDMISVADRLRGEAGTPVKLTVRGADGRRVTKTVVCEAFRPLDVEPIQPGDDQVLRVREFVGGRTRPALLATIDFLRVKEETVPLFIDLRDASGGDLYEALDIAGLFLPAGTLLGILRSPGGERRLFHAPGGQKISRSVFLFVGPETASAAEILAGILQQQGRARLIGRRTYGKCCSQTDAILSDGSVLRYTNSEMLFPDGGSCNGAGLVPEITISDNDLNHLSRIVEQARSPSTR